MADNKRVDFNALGQAIDSTWGRSSTPKTASYSVKMLLSGENTMCISYQAIVNFGTENQMIEMKRRYASEADSVVSATIKSVKSRYKDLSGSSLSTKVIEESQQDSLEIINLNVKPAAS